MAPEVQVAIEDQYGNVETGDNSSILAIAIDSGPAGAAFAAGSTTTATVNAGIATFTSLTFDTAGSYTLQSSDASPAFTTSASNSFVVNPNVATHLVLLTQPSATATAGVTFATQPMLAEEDFYGNILTGDSTSTVTVARGSMGTATLQGASLTATLVDGIATFSGLSYDKAETIDLSFTDSATGVPAAASNNIVVSPNAATQLVVTTQPSATATAGITFAVQPVVAEEDAYGNVITSDSTSTVTAAHGTGTALLQGASLTVTLNGRRGDVQRSVVRQGRDHQPQLRRQRRRRVGDNVEQYRRQPERCHAFGDHDGAVVGRDRRAGVRCPAGGGGGRCVRQHRDQ